MNTDKNPPLSLQSAFRLFRIPSVFIRVHLWFQKDVTP